MDIRTITASFALLGTSLGAGACDKKAEPKPAEAAKPATPAAGEAKAGGAEAKKVQVTKDLAPAGAKGEMKCGEGKCGEGKCGGKGEGTGGTKAEDAKSDKT